MKTENVQRPATLRALLDHGQLGQALQILVRHRGTLRTVSGGPGGSQRRLAGVQCQHVNGNMATSRHAHHAIDYVEFSVADMAAARAFYSAAFGWSFVDYGPRYAGIRAAGDGGGREMGGLAVDERAARAADREDGGGRGGGARPPLVILYSEDIEGSLSRVRGAGGIVRREVFDFPGGRRFEFEDPFGNALAVWSKAKVPG